MHDISANQKQREILWMNNDSRFQISDFRFQISDFRFQVSDFRLQISDFRFQISDFRLQIPDSRFQIPELQIPESRIQNPDSRFQISDSRCQISDFRFQILSQWNVDSRLQWLVVFPIPCPVFWMPQPRIPDFTAKHCWIPDSTSKRFPGFRTRDSLTWGNNATAKRLVVYALSSFTWITWDQAQFLRFLYILSNGYS